jgi:hypothetical protein
MEYGNLNFLEPSGPLQARNGTALPLYVLDIVGFTITLIILTVLTLKEPFILRDPDNFTPANPLVTPVHISVEYDVYMRMA